VAATYQIYALKYGERETKEGQFFFRESSQKPLTLHFFVWVILGGAYPIVVDTGCTEPDAKLKELRAFVSPADMLARVGVKAAEVPMTLVSHLHWDHWGGYPYFPGSTFWMQREELEFWTGIAGQHENYRSFALPESLAQLVRLNYRGRVKLVSGEAEVLPGIKVHWVGGHTAGLQVVSVPTATGTVVLTSDASHFYRNIERRDPVQIITNLPQMLAGFETIDALAGAKERVVVGHDPEVASRFDQVEPGIIKIA
jgi:glyoxylase-like metal-dependent hydrolase (beta-lactamase superfamily II)